MEKICILGAGSWAVALGRHLAKLGHNTVLWEIDSSVAAVLAEQRELREKLPGVVLPDSVKVESDLQKSVEGCSTLLIAVPTRFFEDTLHRLKQTGWHKRQNLRFVIASKGLLYPGGRRLSRYAAEVFPDLSIVLLSGPSHAEEVGRDLPTALVAASEDLDSAVLIQEKMMSSRLRIYTNRDVAGVEVGGALKNVLAIASGLSDGLGFGDNSRAALITRGLREIIALGERLGGQPDTFIGLAGLGDLVVTCTSRHSRNRRLGERIGQGISPEEALRQIGMVAEGYYTARSVVSLEKDFNLELPICREVYRILYEGKSPSQAVDDLMMRERKPETRS